MSQHHNPQEGILLIDKPAGRTSFSVVHEVRKKFQVKKVGHGGTLDPFATGLLVLFLGRNFTKRAGEFLHGDKEYTGTIHLGITTDTYDVSGKVVHTSEYIPSHEEVVQVINHFQGTIQQVPPMFSARRTKGKRLYDLARQGKTIDLPPSIVTLKTTLLRYEYPEIDIHVHASKGTYIRSLAFDIGKMLTSGAHLKSLRRLRSGIFSIDNAISLEACLQNNLLSDMIACI